MIRQRVAKIGLVLLLGLPVMARTQDSTSSVEAKIALEESLERRLKSVISQIVGSDDVIVIVTAEMLTEQERKNPPPARKAEPVTLPGVPVKAKIGEEAPAPTPIISETRTRLKSLSATIVLDKSVSAQDTEVIKSVTTGLLGLTPARGDVLTFQRMDFHKGEKGPALDVKRLVAPPNLFWVSGLGLLALFILFTVVFFFTSFRLFLREFVKALRSYGESTQEQIKMIQMQKNREPELAGRGPANEAGVELDAILSKKSAPMAAAHGGGHGATANGKDASPFSFVHEGNVRNLKVLLKKEKPDLAALVINYLPPALANDVLSSLDTASQSQALSALSRVAELEPEVVKGFEDKIRQRLPFVVGGEDRLQSLLDQADMSNQQNWLTILSKQDSILATRLKKQLFSIDDLAALDPPVLAAIVRRVNARVLANVLRGAGPAVSQRVLANLAPGIASLLKEEIDLAKPLPAQRLAVEQRRILDSIRRLADEGVIQLSKREGGAA